MVSTWGRCETGGCCPSFRNAGSETRGIVERCERQPGSVEEMGSSVSRSSLQNARFGKGCGSPGTDLQESTQLIGINRAGRGSRAASHLRFRSSGARWIASSRRPRREAWSAPRYARWRPPAPAPTSPAIPGQKAHKPAQSRRRRRRGSSGGTRTPPPSVINSGAAPAGVAITGVRHAMASAVSWVDAIASGRLPTSRPNADDQYVKMSCEGVAERSAPRPVLFGPAAGIAGQPSLAGDQLRDVASWPERADSESETPSAPPRFRGLRASLWTVLGYGGGQALRLAGNRTAAGGPLLTLSGRRPYGGGTRGCPVWTWR